MNLLFVKPLEPSEQTNMTVVTNRHTYLFDLVASPRAKPLYVLRFTYPEPPPEEDEEQILHQRLDRIAARLGEGAFSSPASLPQEHSPL